MVATVATIMFTLGICFGWRVSRIEVKKTQTCSHVWAFLTGDIDIKEDDHLLTLKQQKVIVLRVLNKVTP